MVLLPYQKRYKLSMVQLQHIHPFIIRFSHFQMSMSTVAIISTINSSMSTWPHHSYLAMVSIKLLKWKMCMIYNNVSLMAQFKPLFGHRWKSIVFFSSIHTLYEKLNDASFLFLFQASLLLDNNTMTTIKINMIPDKCRTIKVHHSTKYAHVLDNLISQVKMVVDEYL